MSVGAEIWRHIVAKPEPAIREVQRADGALLNSVADPAFSLIHQLFLAGERQRKSILFVTTDREHTASNLCEQIAVALSRTTGQMVGIIESDKEDTKLVKKPAMSFGQPVWRAHTTSVTDRVHRIPSEILCADLSAAGDGRASWQEIRGAFGFFLFSASVTDSTLPLFGNLCDAAVLVVRANTTRREAALRAKEQLIRQRVTLLGTVLDERTLPIPESLYRRL